MNATPRALRAADPNEEDEDLIYLGTCWPNGRRKPPFPPGPGKSIDMLPAWLETPTKLMSRKRKANDDHHHASKLRKAAFRRFTKTPPSEVWRQPPGFGSSTGSCEGRMDAENQGFYRHFGLDVGTLRGYKNVVYARFDETKRVSFHVADHGRDGERLPPALGRRSRITSFSNIDVDSRFAGVTEATIKMMVEQILAVD